MEPDRQLMRIPADPGWQRAILVVLVHRAQVAPARIAAKIFCDARFEIDGEPQELQQEERRSWREVALAPTGSPTTGCEKKADEARAEQHPVGLIAGKILCGRDE